MLRMTECLQQQRWLCKQATPIVGVVQLLCGRGNTYADVHLA